MKRFVLKIKRSRARKGLNLDKSYDCHRDKGFDVLLFLLFQVCVLEQSLGSDVENKRSGVGRTESEFVWETCLIQARVRKPEVVVVLGLVCGVLS